MISKRAFLTSAGALICVAVGRPAPGQVPAISMARHEQFMRLAIDQARKNPVYPFGAVMVQPETGEVMARGVNRSGQNPTFHGEIDCMDDYVRRSGNQGWSPRVLYTTGEPCSMCMSALVWAGINITAKTVIDASPFYKGTLLGGVLQAETDRLFMERKKS
jgi:tRNA(adenine34) deaminase